MNDGLPKGVIQLVKFENRKSIVATVCESFQSGNRPGVRRTAYCESVIHNYIYFFELRWY